MTLLVTGSRDWSDVAAVRRALRMAVEEWGVTHLVHGNARGADRTAANIARNELRIAVKCFNADWEKHGKAAGVLRNAEMLKASNPDVCIAFSDHLETSRGTFDMVYTLHPRWRASLPLHEREASKTALSRVNSFSWS